MYSMFRNMISVSEGRVFGLSSSRKYPINICHICPKVYCEEETVIIRIKFACVITV